MINTKAVALLSHRFNGHIGCECDPCHGSDTALGGDDDDSLSSFMGALDELSHGVGNRGRIIEHDPVTGVLDQ